MNEQIKELIKQATVSEPYYPAGNDGHPEYRTYVSQEKFAKLIVLKCAHIAWLNDEPKLSGIGSHTADAIKEHFGVKE